MPPKGYTPKGSTKGRKRKPTELHILNGNPSKIDLEERQKNEPKFEVETNCPEFLSNYARIEWERLSPQLERLGLLTSADIAAFAAYCESYADFRKASEEIQNFGGQLCIINEFGNPMPHPLLKIKNTALEKMKVFLVEFGFTPASRSKVTVKEEKQEDNGIKGLLSK